MKIMTLKWKQNSSLEFCDKWNVLTVIIKILTLLLQRIITGNFIDLE